MRQKRVEDVLVLFILFKPALGLKQMDHFIGSFEMSVMLHEMKQVPVLKAGIGKRDAITMLFGSIGSRLQRLVAVVVTVKDAPDFVAVFWTVFRLPDQPAGVLDEMLGGLML